MDHFYATKFLHHFSENPANVTGNGIFPVRKTLQKVMKITRFELLWWPFIYRDQAYKRVHKIMQNDAKMHHKSARNDHEKTQIPILQCSKTHAVDRAANLHVNAFIFVVPVLRCSKNEFQNHPKSSRIYPKCPPRGGPIRSVFNFKLFWNFFTEKDKIAPKLENIPWSDYFRKQMRNFWRKNGQNRGFLQDVLAVKWWQLQVTVWR